MKTVRRNDSHKGENGRLLVICGSKDFPGAAYLSASASIAALRTGIDMVTVAAPEKVAWTINSINPDIITIKLEGDYITSAHQDKILQAMEKNDVILIGPGISDECQTLNLVKKISMTKYPKVIDADAIKAIDLKSLKNSIVTPHKKELETLLKNAHTSGYDKSDTSMPPHIEELQSHVNDNIILIKGSKDIIVSHEKILENSKGNPGMTVGGTGDLLSGICAGLLAQGFEKIDAAYHSAVIMGEVGDNLKDQYGYGFIASDFLPLIARHIKEYFNKNLN